MRDQAARRVSLAPPNDDVRLVVEHDETRGCTLIYEGPEVSLIAAGVATPELLAKWPRGHTRRDADGDRCFLDRRQGWVRLTLLKGEEAALRLPGVFQAGVTEQQEFQARMNLAEYTGTLMPCEGHA